MREAFERIYARERWGKGRGSGTGSSPSYCAAYLAYLASILPRYESVLDLGCGDWQLYEGFDWKGVDYVGAEIVESLVLENAVRHAGEFVCADFSDPRALGSLFERPRALVLVKDVLQHWSDAEVAVWLEAVLSLPFETLLVTNNWRHFRSPAKNGQPRDIANPYRWAPIDMRRLGFDDVLYYPRGRYKQVARLDVADAPRVRAALRPLRQASSVS